MNKYENHEEEWREEDKQQRYEDRYHSYIDPRDPAYIATEHEETNTKCGRCGEDSGEEEICEKCMEIMLLGAQDHKFVQDENFYKEIGVKKDAK